MIQVAIASEGGSYDAAVYQYLLQVLLQEKVRRWQSHPPVQFGGWKQVADQAPAYLDLAASEGICHALLAIDNDGGSKDGPEHEPEHNIKSQAKDDEGCRVCLLLDVLPAQWKGDNFRHCVVVPVQTVETWLLCIRGDPFKAPTPEQFYHRRFLKKAFFGKPLPPERDRTTMALEELKKPEAINILRERRSFLHFEEQLKTWT